MSGYGDANRLGPVGVMLLVPDESMSVQPATAMAARRRSTPRVRLCIGCLCKYVGRAESYSGDIVRESARVVILSRLQARGADALGVKRSLSGKVRHTEAQDMAF